VEQTDWQALMQDELEKDYFQRLQDFISESYEKQTIYPPKEDVYKAFELTSYKATKVVILGQDPYIRAGQAHGLSFSVAKQDAKFPPSLRSIFKELATDIGARRTAHDLTDWAEQGVLLLNTVLTVQEGISGSHRGKGWELFTDKIIEVLNDKKEQVIFVLWGADARKKKTMITNPQHKIIESVHPSPLSAYHGFFGSKPFSQINTYLQLAGFNEIIWV